MSIANTTTTDTAATVTYAVSYTVELPGRVINILLDDTQVKNQVQNNQINT
jgi:hypothetical protein